MNRVIPTVFADNEREFRNRFNRLIGIAKKIQIDLMDGKFVKVKSIRIEDIPNLRKYKIDFEVHLMVENPDRLLDVLVKKGFKKIIFHYEAIENVKEFVKEIQKKDAEAWIAVNPDTDMIGVLPFLQEIDGLLFMGHTPGFERLELENKVVENIKKVRKSMKGLKIQVDGGVNLDNIEKLAKIRVNYVNVGSSVANSSNPKEMLKELERRFDKAFP